MQPTTSLLLLAGLAAALPSHQQTRRDDAAAATPAIFIIDNFAAGTVPHTQTVSFNFTVEGIAGSPDSANFDPVTCATTKDATSSQVLVDVDDFDCGKDVSFSFKGGDDGAWTLAVSHKVGDATATATKTWKKDFVQVLQFGAVFGAEVQQSPRFFVNSAVGTS